MQIEKRDVALSVILTFITCGLYGLYWMYKINGEMAPKGAAETTVQDGDTIEFYQEVYQ